MTNPTITAHTEKTVTFTFVAINTNETKTITLPRTAIKGQAQWAARRLQELGAAIPAYGTKERKLWAQTLKTQAAHTIEQAA